MPKCGSCGHTEATIPKGQTISFELGQHPDARNPKNTCQGGKLEYGIVDHDSGQVSWFSEPRWTPRNK